MPDIVIVHVPRISAEAVQELETALQPVLCDGSASLEIASCTSAIKDILQNTKEP